MSMTVSRIKFDICVRPDVIVSDRSLHTIASLDERGLRRIAKGKIFIIFERPRDFIVIESQVYDYVDQILGVIQQIDNGNHETFAVSSDYFSNNLRFTYDPTSKNLEIYDVNGGDFSVESPYEIFRASFLSFYKRFLTEFIMMYPELNENNDFLKRLND